MYGHYDAGQAQNLLIVFERCDPALTKCKSEEQVEAWFKFRYILTIQNRKSFIQYQFDDERINERSEIKYLPMNYARKDHVRMVTR